MKSLYDFIVNRKLHHPLLWLALMIPWLLQKDGLQIPNLSLNLLYLIMTMSPVYINSRLLIPRFLNKNKIAPFIILLLTNILLFSGLLYVVITYFSNHYERYQPDLSFPAVLGPTLGAVGGFVLLFLVIELARNHLRTQQRNRELEKTNLETEIKFLRSQMNPHLLFNSLNNIYFLIKRDQDKAAEALAGFADMLRFQLYESNADKIPLSQEISYLTNYIKLSSLSHEDIQLDIAIDNPESQEQISPLLLIPFIENAFKYVSHSDPKQKYIQLKLELEDKNLKYQVANSFDQEILKNGHHGGIGLENIKRRLNLLYPESYELDYGAEEDFFDANLKIQL